MFAVSESTKNGLERLLTEADPSTLGPRRAVPQPRHAAHLLVGARDGATRYWSATVGAFDPATGWQEAEQPVWLWVSDAEPDPTAGQRLSGLRYGDRATDGKPVYARIGGGQTVLAFTARRFQLTASLAKCGKASANVIVYGPSGWCPSGDTLEVSDGIGLGPGIVGQYGLAAQVDIPGNWVIEFLGATSGCCNA